MKWTHWISALTLAVLLSVGAHPELTHFWR